jgi:hypothetical protein
MEAEMSWSIQRMKDKRNVVEITFQIESNSNWEQWVLLRSDAHHDNPKCRWDIEKKHLEEAMAYDAPVIDNGDLFCAMQGKWDKRSNKDALRPEHASCNYLDRLVDTARDFYRPYRSVFAVLGRGNHETAILGKHETDLTDRLADSMRRDGSPVIASGYSGWVKFKFMRKSVVEQSLWLYHHHGFGGGGPVTKGVIQANRIGINHPDADIVLTGHTHDEWVFPIPRTRITSEGEIYHDKQYHVRAAGYKDAWGDGYGGWEVEKGMGPKALGAVWVRFYFDASHRRRIRHQETLAE